MSNKFCISLDRYCVYSLYNILKVLHLFKQLLNPQCQTLSKIFGYRPTNLRLEALSSELKKGGPGPGVMMHIIVVCINTFYDLLKTKGELFYIKTDTRRMMLTP